jgi:hypothetical protein
MTTILNEDALKAALSRAADFLFGVTMQSGTSTEYRMGAGDARNAVLEAIRALDALATPSTGAVGDEMVEAALAFWCAKLPKAQREKPIPELLRKHMRGTLEAALKASRSDTVGPEAGE